MERDYDLKKAQIFFELCTLKNKARNNLRNQADLTVQAKKRTKYRKKAKRRHDSTVQNFQCHR